MSFSLNTSPEDKQPAGNAPDLEEVGTPSNPGRIVLLLIIAAAVVSLLIGAYLHFGQLKALSTGGVDRVTLYPIHSVLGDQSAGQPEQYDQLLVFAQIHVHNQSDAPLTIVELMGNATLADDTEPSSRAASASDFTRLFGAYPKLAVLRSDPLLRDTVIAPGATAEGLLIFNYSLSKAQWDQRKRFAITVSFSNGAILSLDATHA